MKRIIAFLLVVSFMLAAAPAVADGMLKGIWRIETIEMYVKGKGYETRKGHDAYIEIKDQEGSLFYGVKHWTYKGEKHSEEFSGAVTHDGRLLIQEYHDGQAQGNLLPDGTMVLYYMEAGDMPRVHMTTYKKQ
ncbi:hypothetical protein [Salidesulfovibrio brasiliensis]|uniref:hypothetical protein n=1 Tax=Salidesulfovibrio brasiliensis TaxID=221711 RepID=UPI0006D04A34|nr:hypothetical protein [Salidesulfovibrio brasiliensis]